MPARATLRIAVLHSYRELWTTGQVTSCFAFGSRIEASKAFRAPAPLPMSRHDMFQRFSSTTPAERVDECALLREIEKIVSPIELPKVRQALLEF